MSPAPSGIRDAVLCVVCFVRTLVGKFRAPDACLGLLLVLLPQTPLHAQSGSIRGVVHTHESAAEVLRDVELIIEPGDRATRTDSLGRFVFTMMPTGRSVITARRIGFESISKVIDLSASRELQLRFAMVSVAQRLATVSISGRRVTYPVRLTEAYARAARSTGSFFTAEQIDSLFPLDVFSLLSRVPGIRVSSNRVEFARCRELGSSDQHIQVYVDGQRYTRYSGAGDLTVRAGEALRDIAPTSIQLMEIYSGVARLPGEFLDDACAVILIWRK